MTSKPVRTRYAPSPTGQMHIGNLRTALYEYLIARSMGGSFILRIEDTDQGRLVEGSLETIYQTLKAVGLDYDEGPDVGGSYGPYTQSERLGLYRPYAEKLVQSGEAYYCFCSKDRLEKIRSDSAGHGGYDRHCRDLPRETVQQNLETGLPYVIRQKMPLSGSTTFEDAVYGTITVENNELEDQVLIKSDGFPTYNFANVVDDHLMAITHVVRGSEYLSSTPKYNLLYDAFGWDIPTYVHLPLIVGEDGKKLSKRHGATTFEALTQSGYLPEAIVNAIALLGWCPKDNRELFTLDELRAVFSVEGISKAPSVFSYDKLDWFNAETMRAMNPDRFRDLIRPSLEKVFGGPVPQIDLLAELLQPRLVRLTEIEERVRFLAVRQPVDTEMYLNKKNKVTLERAHQWLSLAYEKLAQLDHWTREAIHDTLINLAQEHELKPGQIMWPLRIALSGQKVTPGGAIEIAVILGRSETLGRLEDAMSALSELEE